MLNLDYPDPKIPGPAPPQRKPSTRNSQPVTRNKLYWAYVWLLDNGLRVFWIWAGLTFCLSALSNDWRWFAWGLLLPAIAACALFVAAFVAVMATRFVIRMLR